MGYMKLILVMISNFFGAYFYTRLMFVIAILIAFLYIEVKYNPYSEEENNEI